MQGWPAATGSQGMLPGATLCNFHPSSLRNSLPGD